MLDILILLGLGVVGCRGQTSKIFQWQFQNQAIPDQLATCSPYPIRVLPFNPANNTFGVPPYFVNSFPVNKGTPVTTPIGTDPNNLSWTVTHPVGSVLLVTVVDSTGGSGGVPPRLFTVTAGQTTQCVSTPPETNPPFTVVANVTSKLETCQPWGITVSGGTPPYIITLAETNSPVITNVTMPNGNNRFTYPNRADPGGTLIAAISDITGRWASGTPAITTFGSSDVNCTGLVSSSGDAATIDAEDAAQNAQLNAAKRRKALVTGVAVTLVLLLAIGCAAIWYLRFRRRRQMRQKHVSEQRVRQFSVTGTSPTPESDVPPTWERFDTAVRPFESSASPPVYGKRGGPLARTPQVTIGEHDVEAPPYQEVDSNVSPVEATAGRSNYSPASAPINSGSTSRVIQEKPSARQNVVRPSTAMTRSRAPSDHSPSERYSESSSSQVSATTSQMVSAFPSVPASIPIATSSSGTSRPDRKQSATFVTFPRKSVRRASSVSNRSNSSKDEGSTGTSVTESRSTKPSVSMPEV